MNEAGRAPGISDEVTPRTGWPSDPLFLQSCCSAATMAGRQARWCRHTKSSRSVLRHTGWRLSCSRAQRSWGQVRASCGTSCRGWLPRHNLLLEHAVFCWTDLSSHLSPLTPAAPSHPLVSQPPTQMAPCKPACSQVAAIAFCTLVNIRLTHASGPCSCHRCYSISHPAPRATWPAYHPCRMPAIPNFASSRRRPLPLLCGHHLLLLPADLGGGAAALWHLRRLPARGGGGGHGSAGPAAARAPAQPHPGGC